VYFFEKFYVDGEEKIVLGEVVSYFIDNFLKKFKVQSKFDPLIVP
jgi:hypothetical protein